MRPRAPDPAQARSLVDAAEEEMRFIETMQPTLPAASTIIRGVYENFRRLGDALLLLQGREGDHEDAIRALVQLPVATGRPIQVLDNLRRLRHDINYRGYQPSQADLDDVRSIKATCWKPVLQEVKRRVGNVDQTG